MRLPSNSGAIVAGLAAAVAATIYRSSGGLHANARALGSRRSWHCSFPSAVGLLQRHLRHLAHDPAPRHAGGGAVRRRLRPGGRPVAARGPHGRFLLQHLPPRRSREHGRHDAAARRWSTASPTPQGSPSPSPSSRPTAPTASPALQTLAAAPRRTSSRRSTRRSRTSRSPSRTSATPTPRSRATRRPPAARARCTTQLTDLLGRFQALYNDGTIPQSTESIGARDRRLQGRDRRADRLGASTTRAPGTARSTSPSAPTRPTIAYPQPARLRERDARAAVARLAALRARTPGRRQRQPDPRAGHRPTRSSRSSSARRTPSWPTRPPTRRCAPLTLPTDPITGAHGPLAPARRTSSCMQSLFYAQNSGVRRRQLAVHRAARRARVRDRAARERQGAPALRRRRRRRAGRRRRRRALRHERRLARALALLRGRRPRRPRARHVRPRARRRRGGQLVYGYIDTSHTYTASLHAPPRAARSTRTPQDNHETMMNLHGRRRRCSSARATHQRDEDVRRRRDVSPYTRLRQRASPLLDLVYAFGQILADPTADDTLASRDARDAATERRGARRGRRPLRQERSPTTTPPARIPPTSTLWDEMIDVTIQIEQEPGLLEDVLRALGDDASLPLSTVVLRRTWRTTTTSRTTAATSTGRRTTRRR